MTSALHRDPDRCCRKLGDWPEPDQRLWRASLIPGGLFEDGGAAGDEPDLPARVTYPSLGRPSRR
jgi:hypothetical protein